MIRVYAYENNKDNKNAVFKQQFSDYVRNENRSCDRLQQQKLKYASVLFPS